MAASQLASIRSRILDGRVVRSVVEEVYGTSESVVESLTLRERRSELSTVALCVSDVLGNVVDVVFEGKSLFLCGLAAQG